MQNKYDAVMQRIKSYFICGDQHVFPSEADIQRLEQQIGFRLPADYREFLSKYGISCGYHKTRYRTINDAAPEEPSLGVFYGLRPGHSYDLKDNWEWFKDDLPPGYLAIASIPGGQLVLALAGDDAGKLFTWGQFRGSKNPYDDLDQIAPNFDSFINTLTSSEEE